MTRSIREQFIPSSEASGLAPEADRLQTATIQSLSMAIRKSSLMDLLDLFLTEYCRQSGSMNTDNAWCQTSFKQANSST